ncbi:hypothetical protein ATE80_30370 [Streptomyces kanasensis]|uniref:Uncharacterized protein n=1 Tax=Streptomyces kanasensis TaxID=936756 RepID=A0A117IU07_9ACTN|nr:hypothetical protein ATE80_30370 [Streptomyces kanasensis]
MACEDCGRERSAGLCEACGHRRQVEVLIGEAGLLAATWSADLTDPVAVAAVAAAVRAAIEADIAAEWAEFQKITDPAALEAAGPDAVEDAAAHNAFLVAESAAAEYRHEALVMLGRSEDAQAEARQAYATELAKPWHQALPDSDDAQRAATEAAAKARPAPPSTCSPCGWSSCTPSPALSRSGPLRGRSACPSSPPARWTARPWR